MFYRSLPFPKLTRGESCTAYHGFKLVECIGAIDNGYSLFFLLTFVNSPGFGGLGFDAKTAGIAKLMRRVLA